VLDSPALAMKLDDISHGNQALLFMERYVDEGARTYSPFAAKTEVSPKYQPRSNCPSFELITINVPRDEVSVFQADPLKSLWDFYVDSERVRFMVHPEIWSSDGIDHLAELHDLPRGTPIEVAPTSSTRTVLTTDRPTNVPAHFIKLHYPRRISRFNRRFRQKNINNSIEGSRDVASVQFGKFAYLPDSLGFTYGNGGNPWGFLIREATPRPYQPKRFLIPYFSLYARDLKHPGDVPLLVQMIERFDAEPHSFVIEEIIIPVLECWAKIARERGILMESHGQNVLLEVDEDFRPHRVVHRDFDCWIDPDARRHNGLEIPFVGSLIGFDTEYPKEQHYSLIYDRFIGNELFDYLLDLLKRFYGANEERVRSCVREAFQRSFPDSHKFFPAHTMFYFSDELLPGNDFKLVDMKCLPEWR
jgi:hypothetical protein